MSRDRLHIEGQDVVVDRASGRIISAGPEEIDATQPLLKILIDEAGWDTEQIVSRPNQWRVPSSPSNRRVWPVDVAVFDDRDTVRDPSHVIILCECKRPDVESGIEQLKIYLDREPHARLGIWFNGVEHQIVYKTSDGYELASPGTPIPTPRDPLTPLARRALTITDLRNPPSLVPVFSRIRDRIATLDSNVNRDEEFLPDISLLLLLKILDEQQHKFRPNDPLIFQIDENETRTARRIREYLSEEVKRNTDIFGGISSNVRFQIDDNSIFYIIETLQNYRLLGNRTDAVADAFQVIRGKAYKGEEGQYFTPKSVVAVAIAAVDPKPSDRVIDPACGSGSFLAAALENVVKHLREDVGDNESQLILAKREWSTRQLFGMDKDSVSVRLSKAYLSMLGDGSTHIFKTDSLRQTLWSDNLQAIIQTEAFDVVVTNPPFGTKLKVPESIGRVEAYQVSKNWKYNRASGVFEEDGEYKERDLGLVFLERSMKLLRPGGRLAIVLPDTYLFSPSYHWLIQWLSQYKITHSINVPIEAFEPHCRAKTSVIVLEKSPPPPEHEIIGCYCETFGEDKHGRPRYQFASGQQTADLDDQMAEVANILQSGGAEESKLFFKFKQSSAVEKRVFVASYWWRKPYLDALTAFAAENDCDLVSVGELIESGELTIEPGHGSPNSHFIGKGNVPYIKVIDIKNWRVIENPKYGVPEEVANSHRRGRYLQPFDLITPTRASKNIGLFGVIMPWQTNVIMTREIDTWRVTAKAKRISPFLLLAMASLKVVHAQFNFLIMMQTNREDLSQRYKELLLPIPRTEENRNKWSKPIQEYFESNVRARNSYEELLEELDPSLFEDRP